MYSSIPNTEWDSNFWTLNFRCFESWTARKLTNASVINSVTDTCIFLVNITVFKDFSRLFHTYDHFQDFSRPWKFYIKFQDFPYFSRICTNLKTTTSSTKRLQQHTTHWKTRRTSTATYTNRCVSLAGFSLHALLTKPKFARNQCKTCSQYINSSRTMHSKRSATHCHMQMTAQQSVSQHCNIVVDHR